MLGWDLWDFFFLFFWWHYLIDKYGCGGLRRPSHRKVGDRNRNIYNMNLRNYVAMEDTKSEIGSNLHTQAMTQDAVRGMNRDKID